MVGRHSLLGMILLVALGGCASVSEDRVSLLEAAVLDLQVQEMRLASLEDTVALLVARNGGSGQGIQAQEELRTEPMPRQIASVKDAPPALQEEQSGSSRPSPVPAPRPVTASSVSTEPPVATLPAVQPPASVPVKKVSDAQIRREYQTALASLEGGKPQAALSLFRAFLDRYPAHSLAPNAGYWAGECHYSMKQYDFAVAAFKDVVAQFPRHEKAAAAMLKTGYSYALMGDSTSARFFLEVLVKDFPSSSPASLARSRLASL